MASRLVECTFCRRLFHAEALVGGRCADCPAAEPEIEAAENEPESAPETPADSENSSEQADGQSEEGNEDELP